MCGRQESGNEASHNAVTRLLVSCIAIRCVYIRLYMYGRSALSVAKYLHMKPLAQAPTQLSVACMRDGKARKWPGIFPHMSMVQSKNEKSFRAAFY